MMTTMMMSSFLVVALTGVFIVSPLGGPQNVTWWTLLVNSYTAKLQADICNHKLDS